MLTNALIKYKKKLMWAAVIFVAAVILFMVKLSSVSVEARKVSQGEVIAEVMGTGTLEARYQAVVSAKIQGRISELLVDQNDRVTEKQLLARLDDSELGREVGIADATLRASQAGVDRLRAEEERAKAVMDQAQRDNDRYSLLVASKSVSQETLEKNREKLAIAEAELSKSKAAVVEGDRQVATSEERLRFEEARLADTRIFSPVDGLVVRRDRELGDIVVPGASIFQLIATKEMWISAWVDESAMAGLALGHPARIVFRSEPSQKYKGRVARLGREVDRETREFKVDVQVDELPSNWAVGQRAEVYIETGRKSGVIGLPVRSIVWKQDKPGVYVVLGGKALWRDVTIGLRGQDRVEAVNGVSENDIVIVGGDFSQLADGRRVSVR
jgi:HlyD family secretion protein